MADKMFENNQSVLAGEIVSGFTFSHEVYGEKCFTTTVIEGAYRFNKQIVGEQVVYTIDEEGDYYLDKNSGIWVLVCFTSKTNSAGIAMEYTSTRSTVGDLESNSSIISQSFIGATVRQLVDIGIIESASEAIMPLTLEQVITKLGEILG